MLRDFEGIQPQLGSSVFVAPTADVIGDVDLGDRSNIWYGSVLRGDVGKIRVGMDTNIQDLTMIHVTTDQFDAIIGDRVTVGHRAILHGCEVGDDTLVGMGAIILDGAVIAPFSLVAAGALVPPGMRVPSGHVVAGTPAKVLRPIRESERELIKSSAPHYVELAKRHINSLV